MIYGALPPLGAAGLGGASALSAAGRSHSAFQAMATVVAATTLVMAAASLGKLLPPRRRVTRAAVARQPPRRNPARDRVRQDGTAWVAVP
ncbi:hypothetical protein ABZ752_02800 [Streptomyces roseifaciens]